MNAPVCEHDWAYSDLDSDSGVRSTRECVLCLREERRIWTQVVRLVACPCVDCGSMPTETIDMRTHLVTFVVGKAGDLEAVNVCRRDEPIDPSTLVGWERLVELAALPLGRGCPPGCVP